MNQSALPVQYVVLNSTLSRRHLSACLLSLLWHALEQKILQLLAKAGANSNTVAAGLATAQFCASPLGIIVIISDADLALCDDTCKASCWCLRFALVTSCESEPCVSLSGTQLGAVCTRARP